MKVCVLSVLLVSTASYGVQSYSQVSTSGAVSETGPKMYKALNMDLIFPKTFNSSENVISTTQTSAPEPVTVAVESLSSTAGEQFTPEYSSSQISADPPPPSSGDGGDEPPIPANHYSPAFLIPDNHAVESKVYGVTLPPPSPATGRAVDYRPAYPFSQLLTPNSKGYRPSSGEPYPLRSRPMVANGPSTAHRVVYPSYQASRTPSRAEIDKLSGKGKFSDRFTPSEGVVSNAFKQTHNHDHSHDHKHDHTHNHKPSITRPVGQSSKKVPSFVASKDLYSFPPNINARYPSPFDNKQTAPSDTVTSYLPPATGPLDTGMLVGPVNPDFLPEGMKKAPEVAKDASGGGYNYDPPQPPQEDDLSMKPDSGDDQGPVDADDGDDNIGVIPAPADDGMDDAPPPDHGDHDHHDDPPPDHDHHHDHHEHHDHHDHDFPIGGYVDDKEYPTPPPGYFEEHDHDHHHHPHHPDIEFAHGPYLDDLHHHHDHDFAPHYPDVIYDDYHDHHFHHDIVEHVEHHPEPIPTTEPPPLPAPAPEQPRVKKYSYFYIGRKLWYIPLYFTLWFTFYVLWLILKSIARHKVNLPNHYVSRRSIEDLNHREAREAIDKLTIKVMDGIEKFKLRFIG